MCQGWTNRSDTHTTLTHTHATHTHYSPAHTPPRSAVDWSDLPESPGAGGGSGVMPHTHTHTHTDSSRETQVGEEGGMREGTVQVLDVVL